jgi:dTMP kinase
MPVKIFYRHEGCILTRSVRHRTGRFVTFEGVEGSGKSTQISTLAERLRRIGWTVLVTREPGGTAVGEQIRDVMLNRGNERLTGLTEAFLVMAARAQHVEEIVRPALTAGALVLCDRFADSTLAYQGYARGLDHRILRRLNRLATAGLIPDMTIVFDIPPAIGLRRRRAQRDINRLDMESMNFHQRVRKGFLQLAKQEPRRIKIVNGTGTQEQISDTVACLIEPLLEHSVPAYRRHRRSASQSPRSRIG